jgi:hypothetical protein
MKMGRGTVVVPSGKEKGRVSIHETIYGSADHAHYEHEEH